MRVPCRGSTALGVVARASPRSSRSSAGPSSRAPRRPPDRRRVPRLPRPLRLRRRGLQLGADDPVEGPPPPQREERPTKSRSTSTGTSRSTASSSRATTSPSSASRHGATSNLVKLVTGRLPVAADEAASATRCSSSTTCTSARRSPSRSTRSRSARRSSSSSGTPTPHGPTVRFHVVGVVASVTDFPTSAPIYPVYVGRGFDDSFGRRTAFASLGLRPARPRRGGHPAVHLRREPRRRAGGLRRRRRRSTASRPRPRARSAPRRPGGGCSRCSRPSPASRSWARRSRARASRSARRTRRCPRSGTGPVQLFGIGMARAAAVGLVGAVGAVRPRDRPLAGDAGRRGAHRRAPARRRRRSRRLRARRARGRRGRAAARRASPRGAPRRSSGSDSAETGPAGQGASRVVGALARTGAPPSVLVGIRHALERGRGRSSVPVATALVGTAAAIVALVAASVFGASLSTLVATPRLYGQDVQVVMSGFSGSVRASRSAPAQVDPAATEVTAALTGKYVTVNGVSVCVDHRACRSRARWSSR